MKVEVIAQPKMFWLAGEQNWMQAVGHEIRVGQYRFCVIGIGEVFNISEVTTGTKVFEVPMNGLTLMLTSTKEDTLAFFEGVIAPKLVRLVEKQGDKLKPQLKKYKKITKETLGKMPPIEDFDDTLITAPISDIKH
ncbi:hypothetical protein GCM10007425_29320 [Lysinibacillus alkalisoli]|uniref:Uncharacterized protein n=1 Tax=Lysinibacillus alkalisoli TaxID=1911548 RepID=A0A917G9X2_9BACI|nr:hypothetical protein [Lysinibacillus alkalisoli]GGG32806.1 hypothetical protein GCM10007425_29320 [Lysinibacillus alkalisoli]